MRDPLARWCKDNCSVHPDTFKLRTNEGGRDASVLWPWDLLHLLWSNGKLLEWVHDPEEQAPARVKEFWAHVRHLPFFKDLKLRDPSKTIPISWHVDGVKVYRTQKAWVYSFASCIRKGCSLHTKLLTCLFRETHMKKPDTHDDVGMLIAYIMSVLQTGCYPHYDAFGEPFKAGTRERDIAGHEFAGGWAFAFAAFKADLEARVMVHKYARNWAADFICEHCPASKKDPFDYRDFSDNAGYLECQFDHQQYLMLASLGRASVWTHVRGWHKDRNVEDFWMQLCFAGVPFCVWV